MLRFGMTATALFLALVATTGVQAGALDDYLTDDNVTEFLEDEDFESIIDLGDAGISSGDLFVGMFSLASINNDPNADDIQLTSGVGGTGGVKGFIVAAIDTYSAGYVTFRAVTSTEYSGLLDGSLVPGGAALSNLPATIAAGTALIVYQSPNTVSTGVSKGTNVTGSDFADINATGFASVVAGGATKAYELGFTDDAFAEAQFDSTGHFQFRLALNVLVDYIGIYLNEVTSADSGFTKLDTTDLPATKIHISGGSTHKDLLADGTTPTNSNQTGAFFFRTDADMVVNAYPEPGSMILAGLGALGVAGAKLRRRKNAA